MSTLVTINGSDLPTNNRADINGNFSALNADKMETSVLDTDTTLAANSNSKVPTQAAVKAYVDAGGNVNASETTKGIVEEATDAEVTAGTATGGTGAKLFVSPVKLATRLASLTPVVINYVNADSPATWTKPAGLKYVVVEVQGAGGGGAGGDFDSTIGAGRGGGAGGYSKKLIVAASLGATETVTIGAGGTGGTSASSPTAGNNGATSSFGSHLSATGGTGGTTSATYPTNPVAGGAGTGGDINIDGEHGGYGETDTYVHATRIIHGGNSMFGKGGFGTTGSGTNAVSGYGAGGCGGYEYNSGFFTNGLSGGDGLVIVTEYYV